MGPLGRLMRSTAPGNPPAPKEIRAAREAGGLSQAAAAELVYSSLRAWQSWEAGDRRMHPAIWAWWRHQVAQRSSGAYAPMRKGERWWPQ